MPINFTQPTITGNYSTGVLQPINVRHKAGAVAGGVLPLIGTPRSAGRAETSP